MLERYGASGVRARRPPAARGRVPRLSPRRGRGGSDLDAVTTGFLSPQVTSKPPSPPAQCLDLELLCPGGARGVPGALLRPKLMPP